MRNPGGCTGGEAEKNRWSGGLPIRDHETWSLCSSPGGISADRLGQQSPHRRAVEPTQAGRKLIVQRPRQTRAVLERARLSHPSAGDRLLSGQHLRAAASRGGARRTRYESLGGVGQG